MACVDQICDKHAMRFLVVGVAVLFGASLAAQGWQRAVAQAEALGAHTGLFVIEGDRVHGLSRADEAFAPASNMKIGRAHV